MSKQATLIQDYGVLDYTAGADITVGDVVPLGIRIGVAQTASGNLDAFGSFVSMG